MVIYYSTILYYVMGAGKFKSLKMGGLNDVLLHCSWLKHRLEKLNSYNVWENVVSCVSKKFTCMLYHWIIL